MPIQKLDDASYPYRLDPYRVDLFGSPAGKRPLVVVHGFSAQVYPMQALMHVLADQLKEHYCVYQYAFETFAGFVPNDVSLEEASRILGGELLRVQREHALGKGIAFVGHSTGGLIARRCFVDHSRTLGTGSFVFLGTPHHGAEIAELKNLITIASLHHEKQTRELAAGSDFIWRLNRDWSGLPSEAIEKVLCVVGTQSGRTALGRIPGGRWVQSDGVVRTTSAALAPRVRQRCVLLHVPLDHGALKDIDPLWQKPGRVSDGLFEGPPVPTRDLPFIATIGFLKGHYLRQGGTTPEVAALWSWCADYLEECEREWRRAVQLGDAYRRTPDGQWHPRTDLPDDEMVEYGLRAPPEPEKGPLPDEPTFKDALTDYSDEVARYWGEEARGAVLIRLDYLNVPPAPALLDLLDAGSISILDGLAQNPAVAIRTGARWATLYVPDLAEGEYRVVWQHADRPFEAKFRVVRHLTTLIEIDGSSGKLRDLSGEPSRAVSETGDGHAALKQLLTTKKWDMEIEKQWIDVRASRGARRNPA